MILNEINCESKLKVSWSALRAHLCTLAVSLSFNSTWWTPSAALRYGGLSFGLALTLAILIVAMPVTLLQLAVGRVSQQDAVGIWRAVPFFRGVGYLRLLVTCLASICSVVHCSLIVSNIFYVISADKPFWSCEQNPQPEVDFEEKDIAKLTYKKAVKCQSDSPMKGSVADLTETGVFNTSFCFNDMLMTPVTQQPGYYIAISLLIVVFWILLPLLLHSPVKLMRRLFFALGPPILLMIIIVFCVLGQSANLSGMWNRNDWSILKTSEVWHAAIVQALWSTQIAGGFLVASADTIYWKVNVIWTTSILVVTTVAMSWLGLLFWFAVGTSDDCQPTLLYQIYFVAERYQLGLAWPLVILIMLLLSGFVTMLTLLFPLYERLRRAAGLRWRWRAAAGWSSVAGALASMAVLAGRFTALLLLEETAIPTFVSIATILEISAFIGIYGWRNLIEDVQFVVGHPLRRYWVVGWFLAPLVILPVLLWWMASMALKGDAGWLNEPFTLSALVVCVGIALLVVLLLGGLTVIQQVQYDFISKLKSAFQPSRQWGPRDPIAQYYWLAGRVNTLPTIFRRFSSFCDFRNSPSQYAVFGTNTTSPNTKNRSNSDDRIYTTCRKEAIQQSYPYQFRTRSKSLEWEYSLNLSPEFCPSEVSQESITNIYIKTKF